MLVTTTVGYHIRRALDARKINKFTLVSLALSLSPKVSKKIQT